MTIDVQTYEDVQLRDRFLNFWSAISVCALHRVDESLQDLSNDPTMLMFQPTFQSM